MSFSHFSLRLFSELESIKANPWRFFEELIKRQLPAIVCGVPQFPKSLKGFLSGPCNLTRKRSTTSVLVQWGSYHLNTIWTKLIRNINLINQYWTWSTFTKAVHSYGLSFVSNSNYLRRNRPIFSTIRFRVETSTQCLAKHEPQYLEDATNGNGWTVL